MIYFTGIGVPRDPKEAIAWCSKAARQRLPLGMFYLGMAYSSGDGIPRNNDFSNRWIRAAADKGLVMAQLTLGMKLSLGDGIERNLDHGVQWLRQAANAGSAEAALQLRRFENLLVKSPSGPPPFLIAKRGGSKSCPKFNYSIQQTFQFKNIHKKFSQRLCRSGTTRSSNPYLRER